MPSTTTFDVIVVGSGGAGLTAAILAHDQGARVCVLERTDKVGGSTAVSGGALWIPLNAMMAAAGNADSREEALAYCRRMAAGQPAELVETFVDTGHAMLAYLTEHTAARFSPWTIPDYHMELEGARPQGRSIETELFSTADLSAWSDRLKDSPTRPPLTLQETIFEHQGHVRPQNLPQALIDERTGNGTVAGGRALVGSLLKGCLDRSIVVELNTRALSLSKDASRVVGVRAERDGGDVEFVAQRGVVLASGGFEWNEQLKRRFLPGPLTHQNSPPSNEGDGLIMAAEAGAALGTMTEIWGSPSASVPGELYDGQPLHRIVVPERMCPHTILVNRSGRRFANEAASYNDLGKVFNEFDPVKYEYRNVPSWAIFDAQYRERYSVLNVFPGEPDPDWLMRADSLDTLANRAGIDAEALARTVESWNEASKQGVDAEFGRHRFPVDIEAPHPSMGSIERAPFYALPVHPGTLGTKGGPIANSRGQVVDERGAVIAGLYAAGNVMAGTSGPGYYGGGATIALAMTWGYICGINAGQAR